MCNFALILLASFAIMWQLPCAAQRRNMSGSRVAVKPRIEPAAASLRSDVKVILVPVTVTDPFGAPFPGLSRDAFRLTENGVLQQVKYFSTEDAPISLGVVFDTSQSMKDKLDQSRQAVARFLETSNPADEFFLVEFSDAPRLRSNFTHNSVHIENSLFGLKPENSTALLDAVYLSIRQMRHASNSRKALLIVSDGEDNHSRYTESEMRSAVREADVCIYSISFTSWTALNSHARLLKQLADETGGLSCRVQKPSELPEAVAKISHAIRNQYLLGYVSSNPVANGLFRRIDIKLDPPAGLPRLRPTWRSGYYAADVQ
jgi:Ca-activated chloride channel family protein